MSKPNGFKKINGYTITKASVCIYATTELLLVTYEDKRSVSALSTKYNAGLEEKSRYRPGESQMHFKKPIHVECNNHLMGAVDVCDQD